MVIGLRVVGNLNSYPDRCLEDQLPLIVIEVVVVDPRDQEPEQPKLEVPPDGDPHALHGSGANVRVDATHAKSLADLRCRDVFVRLWKELQQA